MEETGNNNKKKIVILVAGLVVLVAAALATWLIMSGKSAEQAPPVNTEATDMAAPPAVAEAQVEMTNEGFVPAALHVVTGTRVVWVNTTTAAQRLVSLDTPKLADFGSQEAPAQESYVFTFDTAGDYTYANQTNPAMQGVVHVKNAD